MRLFSKAAPVADRDGKGRFVAGNRYRIVVVNQSIDGGVYKSLRNGWSGKAVSYCGQQYDQYGQPLKGNTRW